MSILDGKEKEIDGFVEVDAMEWSAGRKMGRILVTTPEMGRMGVDLIALGFGGFVVESEGTRRG